MPKEWTDDEVQKEISEAVQIVRADKIDALIRNRLSAPNADKDDKKDNNAPPSSGNSGNDDSGNTSKKRRSLWWGDTEDLSANTSKGIQCP